MYIFQMLADPKTPQKASNLLLLENKILIPLYEMHLNSEVDSLINNQSNIPQ